MILFASKGIYNDISFALPVTLIFIQFNILLYNSTYILCLLYEL